jgi:hypothetical protein
MMRCEDVARRRARRMFARVAVLALAVGLGQAHAAAVRSPCTLTPATGDLPSQSADGLGLKLSAAQPMAFANWNVRWWQRHRTWISLRATNSGEAPVQLLPQMVIDARADGGAVLVQVGQPLALAPKASATQHLTIYIPDDAHTLGVRVLAAPSGSAVAVTFALECSESRFDAGELSRDAAAVLEPALALYFTEFADTPANPAEALLATQRLASGAQDGNDVAWALRGLMQAVGDTHGFVAAPGEPLPAPRALAIRAPAFELRADGTAVARLHAAALATDADALAWASAVHDAIAALAARHPRAWIVDLRDLDGDNPWPALAALSSLLDGPAVGAFAGRHGNRDWIADRGAARIAGGPALLDLQLAPEPTFKGPVAVLLGPNTQNVGEIVAVAFEGRPRTRFFGADTAGFPNWGVQVHELADGTRLGVLETRAADRTGRVYRLPVTPDEVLERTGHLDALPREAVDWVLDEHLGNSTNR